MKVTKTLMSVCALGFAGTALAIPVAPDEAGIVRNAPSVHGDVLTAAPAAGDRGVDAYFTRYDANRDGVISWEEAQQDDDLVRVFSRADDNGDRVLSRAEFQDAAVLAVNEGRSARGG